MNPSGAPADRPDRAPAIVGAPDGPGGDPAAPLREAVEQHLEDWTRRLEDDLTHRLRDGLGRARDAHAALMAEAGLTAAGSEASSESAAPTPEPSDAPPEWATLQAYRRGVHTRVARPLLELLADLDPGRRTSRLWQALLDGFGAVAHEAPQTLRRTARHDRYGASPGDGPIRTVSKALFRAGSRVSGVVRRSAPQQEIPLRRIAATTLRLEDLPGIVELLDQLYRHHAHHLGLVETGLGQWVRDWFALESAEHRIEGHLEPDDRARLSALREQLEGVSVEGRRQEAADPGEDADPSRDDPTSEDRAEAHNAAEALDDEAEEDRNQAARRAAAAGLQTALEAAAELPPPGEALDILQDRVGQLERRLDDGIREAGTPLALEPGPRDERRRAAVRKRLATRTGVWEGWFRIARQRFRLSDEFLGLSRDMEQTLSELMDQTLGDSVFFLADRVEMAQRGLRSLHSRTDDLADAPDAGESTAPLGDEARTHLERDLLTPLATGGPRARVEQAGGRAAEVLADRLMVLPEAVEVHPLRPATAPVDPAEATRTVRLRDMAHQAMDVLHVEAFRTSTAPLLEYLTHVEGECQELAEMVAFNLSTAQKVLEAEDDEAEGPDDLPPPGDGDEEAPPDAEELGLEAAHALSREGLERAADRLEVVLGPAVEAWDTFAHDAHAVLRESGENLHDRMVLEGRVQEQIRDVRSMVRAGVRARVDRSRAFWRRTWPRIRRFAKRRYIRVLRLIRRGRSAMESGDTRSPEMAADVFRGIRALLEPLPLIYRRLYSFQPLTDPTLMVGRKADLAWVGQLYARWQDGSAPPAVITGPPTAGHTSLLNVLAVDLFQDEEVVRITLGRRYTSEAALATRLAQSLWDDDEDEAARNATPGADDPDAAPAWTFARLEERLREDERRPVVLLERLEHVLLRVPGGMDLAEQFLAFQSRTAGYAFWLDTASDPGWKLLATTRPRAAALVSSRHLGLPDRGTLEKLLLTRHRRSGVPLVFVEPDDANPLLRRRIQRARSEKERQAALREDFFDRLHRASQGSVAMAILLWLKAADFTSRPGWLRLQSPRGIRFAFPEELDLPLNFALMAFLEHETLTLAEYGRVFAVPPDEAFQALEALRRRVLIDRLDPQSSGLPVPVKRLDEEARYRIPPIIAQVVAQSLRNQNILH